MIFVEEMPLTNWFTFPDTRDGFVFENSFGLGKQPQAIILGNVPIAWIMKGSRAQVHEILTASITSVIDR